MSSTGAILDGTELGCAASASAPAQAAHVAELRAAEALHSVASVSVLDQHRAVVAALPAFLMGELVCQLLVGILRAVDVVRVCGLAADEIQIG